MAMTSEPHMSASSTKLCQTDNQQLRNRLQNEPDSTLKLLKEAVENTSQQLKQAYESGVDPIELVFARAACIDTIMKEAFSFCFQATSQALSLVAVGGYGRGELHPHSDIDILLILGEPESNETRQAIEFFLMLLWDSKLEIGHSVRTLDECVEESEKDITVATNLMEARHLCGDAGLFEAMKSRTGPDQIWNSQEFFQAKLDEQVRRHNKFHDTAYNLEPNVKENPGGLRDIQMVGWVAKRHFGAEKLQDLVSHDFLTPSECQTLLDGEKLLWQIRTHLHYLTGRREDRLLFDFQQDLARRFGYCDEDNNLAVEQFMQRYYRTVIELEQLNETLLQLFREAILFKDSTQPPEIINSRFQVLNGYIEVRHDKVFQETPSALLEIFLLLELQPHIQGVRASTIRLIRENTHLIDDEFRASDTAKQLFMNIIGQPRGVTHELRRMNRYGIIAAYIPAFDKIVGRMQYDLFHAFTVDQHTLFVIRNMRRLSVPAYAYEYPLASGIFHHLYKPELLYLSGLFHDIAKGRGGDHAKLGALDAEVFCQHHGLNEEDTQLVSWLVNKHLLMSMVAQRQDTSDPEVIAAFARQVGNMTRLDYLYLLTISDIRATNPKMWNSWKDNLFASLYHKTAQALQLGLDSPYNREIVIQETRTSASRLLAQQGYLPEQVTKIWEPIDAGYFLHHSAQEVKWHTQLIMEHSPSKEPMVEARSTETGSMEIFIYAREKPDLFAKIVSSIDQLGMNIVDAQLNNAGEGSKLESFKALESDNHLITPFRIKEVKTTLHKVLQDDNPFVLNTMQRPDRAQKHFRIETEISFEQLPGKDITLLHVTTTDRPGLLARIAKVFIEHNIRLHAARIMTAGEQVDDIFQVTDGFTEAYLDENRCHTLKVDLIEQLQQG